jgi:hypothetical protein
MGSASSHRWRSLSVALRHQLATSFSWLHQPHPQRFVWSHKQEETQEQKQEHVMRHTNPHEVKFKGWEASKIP